MVKSADVGFSLEFEEAKRTLEELRRKYASLLTEYDELRGTIRSNLETEYMMLIGRKEHHLFTLQVRIQQLRREIALYQAALNQGKQLSGDEVGIIIAEEFAEFLAAIQEQQEKLKQAEEQYLSPKLSPEDSKALKNLYHDLVHKLHPDLNPDLPPKARILWFKIEDAYKNWDWKELNILADIAYDLLDHKDVDIESVSSLGSILEQQKKLKEKITALEKQIETEKSKPPYIYRELLSDPKGVDAKRKELDELRQSFEERIAELTEIRDGLRGGKHD